MKAMSLAEREKKAVPVGAPERSGGAPTGEAGESRESLSTVPDPEVLDKPVRRRFTAKYKLEIVQEADDYTEFGQIGALLRREGLFSSHLSNWRQQRDEGAFNGLKPKKRGRKGDPQQTAKIKQLKRENERLRKHLEQAKLVIDVQKKLSEMLGIELPPTDPIEED